MNVWACYIVHYGREWLKWSLRSVAPYMTGVGVFYTAKPSHGAYTNLANPETAQDLKRIITPFQAENVRWFDCGPFAHEGEHRTYAVDTLTRLGADLIVVVDADELWPCDFLWYAINYASKVRMHSFRVGMRHFWRSMYWVCDDGAWPTRLIRTDVSAGEEYIGPGKVLHMGYAQSPELIYYKQAIHGHRAEWREGWFEHTFMTWQPGNTDVHPTSINYWTPVPYDGAGGLLSNLAKDHPYINQRIITRYDPAEF